MNPQEICDIYVEKCDWWKHHEATYRSRISYYISQFDKPLWNAKNKGTVIFRLSDGFGDQIFTVRRAKEIAALGNKVIVSCSKELMSIFAGVEGVSDIIPNDEKLSLHYDYWLPSEFIMIPILMPHKNSGLPYIFSSNEKTEKIGLRWRGHPNGHCDEERRFPVHLMFNAVAGKKCISLQRDHGVELRPDWVEEVPLTNWEETVKQISSCKLVITSDTSISHLSGALGVPTWVLAPHTSSYWDYPNTSNDISMYYNSVTVFRHDQGASWRPLFKDIQRRLNNID